MNLINPDDPPDLQIAKQAKIIDALMRRANRQNDLGPSAFRAFQSAIELQRQVAEQSRDLARAETELESARFEQERTRRALVEALSSMEEGFALFSEGQLVLCNELFSALAPDVSDQILPGLHLEQYFELMAQSKHLLSVDGKLSDVAQALMLEEQNGDINSLVLGFSDDRWYKMNAQHTSRENIVLLLMDITSIVQRNLVEKKTLIERQADYLRAVFQSMSSGVCTLSEAGGVLMHNARFREIIGVPDSVLKPGLKIEALFQFMSERQLIDFTDATIVRQWREELTRRGVLRRRVSHGAARVMDIHVNRMPGGGYLIELKDVTLEARTTETLENRVMERTAELTRANVELVREYQEKAKVEEELRLAKERAEAAVSSKTRFLAAASHDLLQPINAAKLLISTLQSVTRDTDHAHLVDRLEGAFGSAEQLLHSLLDISRLESADPDTVSPTEVSLMSLMQGIYDDQALVAEQKNVRLDMVPSSVFVRSDPIYLLRSVQNLVVNAIQYTNPGGRILVGCRRRGDRVVLEVWDTGIGIALADQGRIFEEFARAGDVQMGSGMGLGLSVVDRACRLLEHKLTLRSKPGCGSLVSIEMDIVPEPAKSADPPALIGQPDQLLDYIVLVIENDRDVLFGATQWLEQSGASVLAAQNGEEALAFVDDMGIPPDIILADYQLDYDDTGLAVIDQIRDRTGVAVPAVLITADRSESLRRAAKEQDIVVMTKPVKIARLRPLIDWKVQHHRATDIAAVALG